MDVLAHLLEPLLMAYAKTLFFIDDHQSQVAKLNVRGKQAVRPDGDIDLALGQLLRGGFHFLRTPQARKHFEAHGERRKASLEGLEMLEGEYGRRSQHRHLLAVTQSLERGA